MMHGGKDQVGSGDHVEKRPAGVYRADYDSKSKEPAKGGTEGGSGGSGESMDYDSDD